MNRLLNDFLPDASAPDSVTAVPGISFPSPYSLVAEEDISTLLKPRSIFSHKGTYGHALIIAGSTETMGAALLAAKGCLCAGAGLTTAAIPVGGLTALNTAMPEVMYAVKATLNKSEAYDPYNAIAIGPGFLPGVGIGTENLDIVDALLGLKRPIVADADMLTFMAGSKPTIKAIAKDSILTPHMKEFDRLFGAHSNWWDRLQTAVVEAKNLKIVIVLKNRYTFIIDQNGHIYINPTGNPAMAQGGMGDVLTGMVVAFVAQGYTARDAALIACYVHGHAGDELSRTHAHISASQIAQQVPISIKCLIK